MGLLDRLQEYLLQRSDPRTEEEKQLDAYNEARMKPGEATYESTTVQVSTGYSDEVYSPMRGYESKTANAVNTAKNIGYWTPYIGNALFVNAIANDAKQGNYLAAAAGLGLWAIPYGNKVFGKVKYYGPTMGKTTAAKTNSLLVDFDDIVRDDIQALAEKKGMTVRELKMESVPEYTLLLKDAIAKWRSNPENKNKTLVVSNAALSTEPIFDNVPMIPSKEEFVRRQIARGEGDAQAAALYYDDLLERNPNLKIEDRYVSELESNKED